MFEKMGAYATRISRKYMPDPIIFAFLLTIVAYILTVVFTDETLFSPIVHWYDGFWNLLAFSMQICLMMITGYALAVTKPVKRVLESLSKLVKTPKQAVLLTSIVVGICAYVNWAMAAIVGAVFVIAISKHCYKNGIKIHYPFLVAVAVAGQSIWAWGISNTIALMVNTPGHFVEELIGIVPMSETVFGTLGIVGGILIIFVVTPLIFYFMTPSPEKSEGYGIDAYAPELLTEEDDDDSSADDDSSLNLLGEVEGVVPADRLDNSKLLGYILATMGLGYIVYYFWTNGFSLTIDIFNFIFLSLGLYIYGSPAKYLAAIKEGVSGITGVLVQYPFYGGIMGLISGSGLGTLLTEGLMKIATSGSFLVLAWLISGIINIFVPSQGGEFAVTGHVMMQTAMALDVSIGKTAMACAVGDGWTNLFQPFFALPILGLCKVRAREIMGYCVMLMLLQGPVYALIFLLL